MSGPIFHPELEDILLEVVRWVDQQDDDLTAVRCANGVLTQLNDANIVLGGVRADAAFRHWKQMEKEGKPSGVRHLAGVVGQSHQTFSQSLKFALRRKVHGLDRPLGQAIPDD